MPLPYAHHDDSSHADEFETETENEEDEGDGSEDGILVNFCRVSLDNDFHGLVPLGILIAYVDLHVFRIIYSKITYGSPKIP